MYHILNELGRRFKVDQNIAFVPISKSVVVYFDKNGFDAPIDIEKEDLMASAPAPSATNGIGIVSPGYGKLEIICSKNENMFSKNKRFLELIELSSVKTKRMECFHKLIVELQKKDKQYSRLKEQLSNIKADHKKIIFWYQGDKSPMFSLGTKEGKWWEKEFPNQYNIFDAPKEGSLYATCIVRMKRDIIPRIHNKVLAGSRINPNGFPLYARNFSSVQQPGYLKSESSRIGLTASRRISRVLAKLINNNLVKIQGGNTCTVEYYSGKNVYNVYCSPNMGEELKVINMLTQNIDKSKDENAKNILANQYIAELLANLSPSNKKGEQHSDISIHRNEEYMNQQFMFIRIFETKGAGNIAGYEQIPVHAAFKRIKKWFEDLTIQGYKGQIIDWFPFWQLQQSLLSEAELSSKNKPSIIDYGILYRSALHGHNIPTEAASRTALMFIKDFGSGSLDENQLKKIYTKIALLKMYMIRKGYKISTKLEIKGTPTRAYLLGILYRLFQEAKQYVEFKIGQESNYNSKFLNQMITDPRMAIEPMTKDFDIYIEKLETKTKRNFYRQISSAFSHINVKDLRPIVTAEEKIWFILGWYAAKIKYSKKDDNKVLPVGNAIPNQLGEYLATFYTEYNHFCYRQKNPDIFFGTYMKRFMGNPLDTIRDLKEKSQLIWKNYLPYKKLHDLLEWRKKIEKNLIVPAFIPVPEHCEIIQGFFVGLNKD